MADIHSPILRDQIMEVAPSRCEGCEALFDRCSSLSIKVGESALTLDEAREELQEDLETNCPRGRKPEHRGWGGLAYVCTYDLYSNETGYQPRI